ncbi:ABC transporter permease [Caulobacter sp. 17J65-9]|uniref:ABC transporter permease n=1 Tax=Caulobacter sp. 17J65-9 TaxID=2709382 RepID=UPI0013C8C476|nr:ABC transporter permease [Caulobacter sp. 17J65-9]NEX93092.1 ABC transporter permease [Caulobacter sp. 17J65-9]
MLADALACEGFKLWRNRAALFWGFLFVPLVALVIGVGVELWFRGAVARSNVIPALDLARVMLKAVADAGSPFTQLFLLIAGASVFGGEYRWETWRLLTPRNSRANLLAAKALVVAAAAAASVALIAFAGIAAGLIGALGRHAPTVWNGEHGFVLQFAGLFLISWLQVLQPLAVGALAAVVSRSILAAVMTPIVLGVVQALMMSQLGPGGLATPPLWGFLALPGLSVELLRAAIGDVPLPAATIWSAGAALAGWVILPVVAAGVVFQRQDLSRE